MYSDLQHFAFSQLTSNKSQVLLGIDAQQYIIEQEFLQGSKSIPFAVRNLLGWTITEPIKKKRQNGIEEVLFLSRSCKAFVKELTLATLNDN